jgi:hypothetical protein
VGHVDAPEPFRVLANVERDVLALRLPARLAIRVRERLRRQDLGVEPVGEGRRIDVRGVVEALPREGVDDAVDLRVDQRQSAVIRRIGSAAYRAAAPT